MWHKYDEGLLFGLNPKTNPRVWTIYFNKLVSILKMTYEESKKFVGMMVMALGETYWIKQKRGGFILWLIL